MRNLWPTPQGCGKDANQSKSSWVTSDKGKAWKAKGKHQFPW